MYSFATMSSRLNVGRVKTSIAWYTCWNWNLIDGKITVYIEVRLTATSYRNETYVRNVSMFESLF